MASSANDLTNNHLGDVRVAANTTKRAAISAVNFAKFQSISTMRTALVAAGYSNAKLDTMSKNDMSFALRRLNNLP